MSAKVSAKAVSQVENQIPQFISDENPLYEKFLKNYYEFLETLCVYYTKVGAYTTLFTNGETVTGQTSGAVSTILAEDNVGNALYVEANRYFQVGEIITGGTSSARATIGSIKEIQYKIFNNF